MKRIALSLVAIVLLVGCGAVAEEGTTEQLLNGRIERWHDDEMNVTCWFQDDGDYEGGMSCIPDWQLEPLGHPTDIGTVTENTFIYECTQIGCGKTPVVEGEEVEIVGRTTCTWILVSLGSQRGFIYTNYIDGNVPDFNGCPREESPFQDDPPADNEFSETATKAKTEFFACLDPECKGYPADRDEEILMAECHENCDCKWATVLRDGKLGYMRRWYLDADYPDDCVSNPIRLPKEKKVIA